MKAIVSYYIWWQKKISDTNAYIDWRKNYMFVDLNVYMTLNGWYWYMPWLLPIENFSVFVKGIRIQRHNLKKNICPLSVSLFHIFLPTCMPIFHLLNPLSRFAVMLCTHCTLFSCFSTNSLLVFVCLPIFSLDAIHFERAKKKQKNIYQAFKNNPLFRLLFLFLCWCFSLLFSFLSLALCLI